MSQPPIEFRYFLRYFTLEDAAAGAQPLRMQFSPSGPVKLYAPLPALQYRYRERIGPTGDVSALGPQHTWTEWITVPVVREGDGDILSQIPTQGVTPS